MAVGTEIAVGTGVGGWSGASIRFNNKLVDQDACKNVVVNLHYVIA